MRDKTDSKPTKSANSSLDGQSKSEISSSAGNHLISSQSSKPDGEKHICLHCGKQFNKRDFLQKHKIVHEIPRHKCMACDKSFVREDKLKRHFTSIHSKHRPHICDVCSKAFARKDKLKDHQKHHLTAGNSFQCTECYIPFVQKSDLNRHFRGVHKGEDGVGINIPSKRFTKSNKSNDDITPMTAASSSNTTNPQPNPPTISQSQMCSTKPAVMISSPFYPIHTSPVIPPNANHTQINNIIDPSPTNNLIKSPNLSFIPAIPLKVELNYTGPSTSTSSTAATSITTIETLPQSLSSNSFEKENVQVKFKSKRSVNRSKSKPRNSQSDQSTKQTKLSDQTTPVFNGKNEPPAVSSAPLNCLVSQGTTTLYPRIPIITPFQSPSMISVFPSNSAEFYSRTLTTPTKSSVDTSTFGQSPSSTSSIHAGYSHPPLSIDHNNAPIKPPPYSMMGSTNNNIALAHQNLYQNLHQNPLRYYSYLQPASHLFGQHSTATVATRPLTANVYPYMPF